MRHDKRFRWSPGLVMFKVPKTYQATCFRSASHWHELGHNTRCTRTRTFQSAAGEVQVIRELKHWLNVAGSYSSRLEHMSAVLHVPEGDDANAALLSVLFFMCQKAMMQMRPSQRIVLMRHMGQSAKRKLRKLHPKPYVLILQPLI